MSNTDLSALREQIDELDAELVVLLARRFRITQKVGLLKAAQGLGAVDSEREARQEQRLAELAVRHTVSPALVASVFRCIVSEVVSNHQSIAQSINGTSR